MKVLVEKLVEPVEKEWGVNSEIIECSPDKTRIRIYYPDDSTRTFAVGIAGVDKLLLDWLAAVVEAAIEQDREIRQVDTQDLETEKEMLQLEHDRLKAENKQQQVRHEAQAHNYSVLSSENCKLTAANAEWRDACQKLRDENTQLQAKLDDAGETLQNK